jgi:hypothetical protein
MTSPEQQRDKMMEALMSANAALVKVRQYAETNPDMPGVESFRVLLPYHEQIIQDVTAIIFNLPEGERIVPAHLRSELMAKRAETEDILYFEALDQFVKTAFAD